MKGLTPSMVKRLIAQKHVFDQLAEMAKAKGDKIDYAGGDSEQIQQFWGKAAEYMHVSIAIGEYLTKHASPNYHKITGEDVGRTFIKIGGVTRSLSSSIGKVTVRDIGRKLYVIDGLVYMGA